MIVPLHSHYLPFIIRPGEHMVNPPKSHYQILYSCNDCFVVRLSKGPGTELLYSNITQNISILTTVFYTPMWRNGSNFDALKPSKSIKYMYKKAFPLSYIIVI